MRQKLGISFASLGIALAGLSSTPLIGELGLAMVMLFGGLIITAVAVVYGMSGQTKEEKAKVAREKAMQELEDTKARHALVNEDTDLAAETLLVQSKQSERMHLLSVAENYSDSMRAELIRGEMAPVEARVSAINNRRAEIAIELEILRKA